MGTLKIPDKEDLRTMREIAIRVWGDKQTLLRSDTEFVDKFTDDPEHELTLTTLVRWLGNDQELIGCIKRVGQKVDHGNGAAVKAMYDNHDRLVVSLGAWISKLRHEKTKECHS